MLQHLIDLSWIHFDEFVEEIRKSSLLRITAYLPGPIARCLLTSSMRKSKADR